MDPDRLRRPDHVQREQLRVLVGNSGLETPVLTTRVRGR
jgi:hypothetical protein